MRRRRGSVLIFLGCMFVAMGGLLTAYNLYEAYAAGNEVQKALGALEFLREQPAQAGMQASLTGANESTVSMALQNDAGAVSSSAAEDQLNEAEATLQSETFAADMQPDTSVSLQAGEVVPEGETLVLIPGEIASEIEIPDYMLNPEMEMPVILNNGQEYIGVLEIPSLDLELPIISEWNYARLKKAPCRYAGSAYTDDLVIAAHNYESHFGRLKDLSLGDAVSFTDVEGNRFEYEVVLKETLMPRDVNEMKSGEFDLSLFTCTVGGSYRVTVRCDRIMRIKPIGKFEE